MQFMLDTCACVDVIRQRSPAVLDRIMASPLGSVGISTIVLSELQYGAEKSSDPGRNRAALLWFLAPVEIMPFDDRAACAYGPIRAALERLGRGIGAMDMLIAAHALALRVTLVTSNTREFERVEGLALADWSS